MNKLLTLKFPFILQVLRFAIVGLMAAAVHFGTVVSLVQVEMLQPLIANIFGFVLAFQVSYWGHRLWTFYDTSALHRTALPKLFFVQILNLAANETLFYIFLLLHLPYTIALLIVLMILPLFTFAASKWWVFG
ncbi:MAG: GtrA family protein [Gammaproteobacteria bacterium]|nr:GtrA family protein [Gammaproteobacteria bacterium]